MPKGQKGKTATREWLETAYVERRLPVKAIAAELRCAPVTLKRELAKFGITRFRNGKDSPRWKGHGDISSTYWTQVQHGAEVRGLCMRITIEYAWQLFQTQGGRCALSGLPIRFGSRARHPSDIAINATASLDRIDNDKGYLVGNVQWVHKAINIMKKTHSVEEFVRLCATVAKWRCAEAFRAIQAG